MNFFTADWHLNGTRILDTRPWKDVKRMNQCIMKFANQRAGFDDTIYHAGDLFQYGDDGDAEGLKEDPMRVLDDVAAQLINLEGNHDSNNKSPIHGLGVLVRLTKKAYGFVQHYPTYHALSIPVLPIMNGHEVVNIHGHFHTPPYDGFEIPRVSLDRHTGIINVNVATDLWKFQLVTASEIMVEVNRFKAKLFKNKAPK